MKRDLLAVAVGGAVCYLIVNILYPFASSQQDKQSPLAIRAKPPTPAITVAPHECDCESEYYRRELQKRWAEFASICITGPTRIIQLCGDRNGVRDQITLLLRGAFSLRDIDDAELKELKKRRADLDNEIYAVAGKVAAAMSNLEDIVSELRKLGDHSNDSKYKGLLDGMGAIPRAIRSQPFLSPMFP